MTPAAEAAVRTLAALYPDDPLGYTTEYLNRPVTPQQADFMRAVAAAPRRVLVPSANKVGKTFGAGALINWHHDNFTPGIVLATSTTGRQVKNQLFKEVRRLRPFGLNLLPRAPEIRHTETHFVQGFSTNRADGFQGNHEGALLLVMDEATGIPAEFSDRAETMFSGERGHGWVCFYNPNDPTTWVYAAEQSGAWPVVRLSALDHPNIAAEIAGRPPPFPAAIRLRRVQERIDRECEAVGDAPVDDSCFEFPPRSGQWWKPGGIKFEPQILGRWPSSSFEAVWTRAEWERCQRGTEVNPAWSVQIGCDVSRFGGDKTAFAVRRGPALVHLELISRWRTGRPSQEIADRLRDLCRQYVPAGWVPEDVPCLIDDTGGYGSGVVDYPEGFAFFGINASEAAYRPSRFPNRRSELWGTLRTAAGENMFVTGNCRTGHEHLAALGAELQAARCVPDSRGRRVVEGKAAMKERLGRSPDVADAVCLAWYPVPGDEV